MRRAYRLLVAALATAALWSGAAAGEEPPSAPEGDAATRTNAVAFDVQVLSGGSRWGPPQTTWRATYPPASEGPGAAGSHGGKVARFEISLPHRALGRGTFRRDPDCDASLLLRDLGRALRGRVPEAVDPVDELTVTFYVLGDKMSQTETGGFRAGGQGDWLLVKVFVGRDESASAEEGSGATGAEFYLNINEKSGKGEIRMKDPDYGDAVLGELSKVFSPAQARP